jgi:hypothetical protein
MVFVAPLVIQTIDNVKRLGGTAPSVVILSIEKAPERECFHTLSFRGFVACVLRLLFYLAFGEFQKQKRVTLL